MIGKMIGVMFLSREVAHREHLKTHSFAQHMALGSFYDGIVGIADSIVEMYQGRNGIIDDIPMIDNVGSGSIDKILETHLKMIEKMRYTAVDKSETAIQNEIDTAVGLYLSTLYKLRNLK